MVEHQRLPATHRTFTVTCAISLHTLHCLNHACIMSPSRRSHRAKDVKCLHSKKRNQIWFQLNNRATLQG